VGPITPEGPSKALKYGAAASVLSGGKVGLPHVGGASGNKLVKYGVPLAAGYVAAKGIKKGFGVFGGGCGDWSDGEWSD